MISDKLLQFVLNRMPVMVLYLSAEGLIVRYVNNLLHLPELEGLAIERLFPQCAALLQQGIPQLSPFECLTLQSEQPFFRSFEAYLLPEEHPDTPYALVLIDHTSERVAREKFEQLFEHTSQALLLMDTNGLLDCNPAAISMLGCSTRQEVLSCKHLALFSPDRQPNGRSSVEAFVNAQQTAFEKGIWREEWLLRRLTGEMIPAELTLLRMPHQETLVASIQDLTARTALFCVWENLEARKEAERKLRENARLFQDITDHVPGLLYQQQETPEGETRFVFISNARPVADKQSEALQPDDLKALQIHSEDQAHYAANLESARQSRSPLNWEGRIWHHTSESYRWVRLQANPRSDETGSLFWTGTLMDITARKAREENIRRSEAHLQALVSSIQEGIWSLDRHLRLQTFNQRMSQLFATMGAHLRTGQSLEQILSEMGLSQVQQERWLGHYRHALQGRSVSSDYQFVRNEQKYFLEFGLNPIVIDGDVVGVVTSARDISHRKRAEELLNEQRLRNEKILDFLPISIFEKDARGRYTFINKQTLEFLDRDPDEILGKTDLQLFPAEVAHPLWSQEQVLRQRQLESLVSEDSLPSPEGHRHLLMGKRLLNPREAHDSPLVGYALDITERKASEHMLLQSEQDLKEAQRMARMGSFRMSYPSGHMEASEYLCSLLELSAQEMLSGQVLGDLIHPDDFPDVVRQWEEHLNQGSDILHMDYRVILPRSGRNLSIFSTVRMVRNASGEVYQLLGTLQDITERKHIENELRQARDAAESANRAKSEFLTNMSHEIRTPLNAVLGFSKTLEQRIHDPELKSFVRAIKSGGSSLLTLINDILDLSKIESGKLEITPEKTSLHHLFGEIEQMFSPALQDKHLSFEVEIAPDLPKLLLLDAARLRQIVFNLLGNAIKFTHLGFVRLSVRGFQKSGQSEHLDLLISVEDSGIGIPPESHQRIFESFHQQDSQTTKQYGGTGLGLAITRRLVEMMQGTIQLDSVPGQGSRFTVTLPRIPLAEGEMLELPIPNSPLYESSEETWHQLSTAQQMRLLQQVESVIIPMFETTRRKRNFKLIQQLAETILQTGQEEQIPALSHYGERLRQSAENFDIHSMNHLLEDFPEMVKRLRKAVENEVKT
ncbi:MAG: PAS domain S-box protein [Candidatus Sericytochromatia bacterium]